MINNGKLPIDLGPNSDNRQHHTGDFPNNHQQNVLRIINMEEMIKMDSIWLQIELLIAIIAIYILITINLKVWKWYIKKED